MKQTKRFLALGMAACLLLLGACGNNGAGDSSAEDELKTTAVEVQTVAQGEMAASNTLAGQVTRSSPFRCSPCFPDRCRP